MDTFLLGRIQIQILFNLQWASAEISSQIFQIYRPAFIDPVVLNLVLFVINDIKISEIIFPQ